MMTLNIKGMDDITTKAEVKEAITKLFDYRFEDELKVSELRPF